MNEAKGFLLAAGIMLALAFPISCEGGNNPSSLVGQWELASPGAKGEDAKNFEFFKDGTGMVENVTVSWKVEGKRLAILSSLAGQSFEFKVSGYELTCIEDDGDVSIYVRKGKLEEFKAKRVAEFAKQVAACAKKGFKTVKIGSQTWMAENLNCDVSGSKCYDNDEANCTKYGRLYNWETAMAVCPQGWHLPDGDEWKKLVDLAGGDKAAGAVLKAASGWKDGGNGTDKYGFSALPGGSGRSDGSFRNVGNYGNWWSAREYRGSYAYYRGMDYDDEGTRWDDYYKTGLLSVRCVEGETEIGTKAKGSLKAPSAKEGETEIGTKARRSLKAPSAKEGETEIGTKAKSSLKTLSARDIDMGSGDGSRSKTEIMAVVNARMSGLRNIYNKYLKLKPGFSGKVILKFTIAPSGDIISISIVSSTTGYAEFDEAVKNMVGTWKWKTIKSGNTTPTIPFDFTE